MAERTPRGVRQSVDQDGIVFHFGKIEHLLEKTGHVFTNLAGLSVVIMADREYPQRVVFALINRIMEEFSSLHSREVWMSSSRPIPLESLKDFIQRYQNPKEADAIMRVQNELDETKVILVRIFKLLNSELTFSIKPSIRF